MEFPIEATNKKDVQLLPWGLSNSVQDFPSDNLKHEQYSPNRIYNFEQNPFERGPGQICSKFPKASLVASIISSDTHRMVLEFNF